MGHDDTSLNRLGHCRLLFAVPVLIGLALITDACGGSPGAGVASLGSTSTTTTAVPVAASGNGGPPSSGGLVQYATCMRSHGVASFPDPASIARVGIKGFKLQISKTVASSPRFQVAQHACAKYAPAGISPPQITTEDQADYLKAADCMRNHGIVGFPDPLFPGGGQVDFPIPKSMNPNSTEFRRAREICELLIPAGLPYSKEAEGGQ